jgi:hypothetical protein
MKPKSPPPADCVAVYEKPPRSGNEVNGRGISSFFKPQHVFHTNPSYYGIHDWFLMNRFFHSMASLRSVPQSLLIRWHTRNANGPVASTRRSVSDSAAMSREVKEILPG